MLSEKVARILRSRTDMTEDELGALTEGDAWKIVYALKHQPQPKQDNVEICFTGFSPAEKRELINAVLARGFIVRKSVTQRLTYLCTGPNAGPVKLENARKQGVALLARSELIEILKTGDVT